MRKRKESTKFKLVAIHPRQKDDLATVRRHFDLLTNQRSALDGHCAGDLVARVEYAYDAEFAKKNGAADNISRRFISSSDPDHFVGMIDSFEGDLQSLSFHEVIPPDTVIKPWFDLDGFDVSICEERMIQEFSDHYKEFFAETLGITIDIHEDLKWSQCTRSDPTDGTEETTKNSLHMTMANYTIANNEIEMKALASSFINYMKNLESVTFETESLLKPGVIDLAVYRKTSSIRLTGSPKIGDPYFPFKTIGDAKSTEMYITTFFSGEEVMIPPFVGDGGGVGGVTGVEFKIELLLIVKSALNKRCDDIDGLNAIQMEFKSVAQVDHWWYRVVVKNYATCKKGKTSHSDDTDVYFMVSMFFPYVIQHCHSGRCPSDGLKMPHTRGHCRDMVKTTNYNNTFALVYMEKVADRVATVKVDDEKRDGEKRDLKPKEVKSMILSQASVVFEFYYNRFFGIITDEDKVLVAVKYYHNDTKIVRHRVVTPSEFSVQRATSPFIRDWMESAVRKEYQQYTFSPWDKTMIKKSCVIPEDLRGEVKCDGSDLQVVKHTSPEIRRIVHDFNMFTGLGITHKEAHRYGMSKTGAELTHEVLPFLNHIKNVWCGENDEISDWVLHWLASCYLRPWARLDTAIVLNSKKGSGKGVIMKKMGEIINGDKKDAGCYWHITTLDPITGTYQSEQFMRTTLLFADEAVWSGNPKTANRLKGLVTEEVQNINPKFKPSKTFKSVMNLVIASNNTRAVEITEDNRRFQMLDMKPMDFAGDISKRAYFSAILNIQPIAIAAYFLKYTCFCSFDSKKIFSTEKSSEALLECSPFDAWWYNILCGNSDDDSDVDQNGDALDVFNRDAVGIAETKADFDQYMRNNHSRVYSTMTTRKFISELRLRCRSIPSGRLKQRRIDKNNTQKVSSFSPPLLSQARLDFSSYTGRTYDYTL